MASIAFDTHKFVRTLKDAGMPEPQAEAISSAFQNAYAETDLATKRDLGEVGLGIKRDIKDLELKIEQVRSDLKRDMVELEQRLIIKLGGMMVAAIAIVATLVKLL
jgi:hypothetical protein